MGNGGIEKEVSLEEKEGKKRGSQQHLSLDFCRISEVFRIKTAVWDLDRGMRSSRVFESQQFFDREKFLFEGSKTNLATFGIIKFYRWLTVAPLGDVAFLKASRIQT